jgi:hypothetical protein
MDAKKAVGIGSGASFFASSGLQLSGIVHRDLGLALIALSLVMFVCAWILSSRAARPKKSAIVASIPVTATPERTRPRVAAVLAGDNPDLADIRIDENEFGEGLSALSVGSNAILRRVDVTKNKFGLEQGKKKE